MGEDRQVKGAFACCKIVKEGINVIYAAVRASGPGAIEAVKMKPIGL